jgi:hypothetical protein
LFVPRIDSIEIEGLFDACMERRDGGRYASKSVMIGRELYMATVSLSRVESPYTVTHEAVGGCEVSIPAEKNPPR